MSTATASDTTAPTGALPGGFALVVVARFASNVSFRAVYPFLPAIADGLGVSLTALGTAIALQQLSSLASPLVGGPVDRSRLGTTMTVSLAAVAASTVLVATSGSLLWFTIALTLLAVSKNVYDVASAAWVGRTVPFSERGRAIGIVEMTWAGSFLLAMPVAALLIRAGTWRTPFLLTAVATVPLVALFSGRLRQAGRAAAPEGVDRRLARQGRAALLAGPVAAIVAVGVGHQALLVSFASWLEDTHGLTVASLGLTAVLLGAAELGGTVGAIRVSDRIGKRTSALGAYVVLVPAAALLPAGGASLVLALALLGACFALFEFGFVSFLSLVSELDPAARATMLAWVFGGFGAGHSLGAVVGSAVFESVGIGGVAAMSAACFALAGLVIRASVEEPS